MIIVINPYHLFGLNIDSTLLDLKKSYYELSLICHPDRGGDKQQMITVHNSYLYLKKQLSNHNHQDLSETYQDLEQQFQEFCLQQTKELPDFYTIYDENNDFINKFNTQFEKRQQHLEQEQSDPFQSGYSTLMEPSDNQINNIPEYPLSDCDQHLKNQFKQQIIEYQEPKTLPDNYGNYFNFNVSKIDDFSHQSDTLEMTDYLKAHSNPLDLSDIKYKQISLKECIEERKQQEQDFQLSQNVNKKIISKEI